MPIRTDFVFQGRSLVRDVFIETGTFKGDTAAAALGAGFDTVHTIEVCPRLHAAAVERFAGDARVTAHLGTSPDVLARVIDPGRATTIYLDGHFSGDGGASALDPAYGECPLVAELKVITGYRWAVPPVVVVDDFHMMKRPWTEDLLRRFSQLQWPTADQVLAFFGGREAVDAGYELYVL